VLLLNSRTAFTAIRSYAYI